jgi:hypothetical protein
MNGEISSWKIHRLYIYIYITLWEKLLVVQVNVRVP